MKHKIKTFIAKLYISLFNNKILHWVKDLKKELLLKQFKKVGYNFNIQPPYFLKGVEYMETGENFSASNNLRLECWDEYFSQKFTPSVRIGNNVIIEKYCHIGCINNITIGNDVLIASHVYISDHSHGNISEEDLFFPPSRRLLFSKGPVIIEDNVWIGQGVCILPNVTIGKNAIIGANSVVTKNIPENSVAAGNPAKILKHLK